MAALGRHNVNDRNWWWAIFSKMHFCTNNFISNKVEMLVKCASDETSEFNTLYIKVKFNRWAHSVSDRLEMSLAERYFGIIEVRNGWFN